MCCSSPCPPRNARAEAEAVARAAAAARAARARRAGRGTGRGPAFLRGARRAAARRGPCGPRCPGPHWPDELARAVAATLASGRGALVVVPDGRRRRPGRRRAHRAAGRGAACAAHRRRPGPRSATGSGSPCGAGRCGPSSAPGPPCSRPSGTSGLVAVWDDGDSSHSDDNAPFPHVREVLELRAAHDKCGFLLGEYELHGGGRPAGGERLGAAAGRRPRAGARRRAPGPYGRRRRAGPGRGGPGGPAAQSRLADRAGRAEAAARCWSRCRAGATCPGSPASAAATPARCRHCAGPLEAPRRAAI